MPGVHASSVTVAGHPCRVLESGSGAPVVYFAGIGGLPRWSPFLDVLATTHHVMAPSLPGFPGSPDFRHLDDYYEWIVATLELLEALDTPGEAEPINLIASSVAAPLAAEVAAIATTRIRRLVLIAPFGMYDATDPTTDIWAQRPGPAVLPSLLCNDTDQWKHLWQMPPEEDPVEWGLLLTRSMEAAARFLFPMGNTGIEKRLYRIRQPTLLIRGADDRVVPASYQQRFAARLGGPVVVRTISAAGHVVELDQAAELTRQISAFFIDQQY